MHSIFLTGATSFLGRNVVRKLISEKYEVYALVRRDSKFLKELPESPQLHLLYGSLEEVENVINEIPRADVCIHFAWDGSGNVGRADQRVQEKNVNYSMRVLEVANKIGCKKFIFSGSQAEYGICKDVIDENTKCNPRSEYGKAKLRFSTLAKEYCELREIVFLHLRIFSVYGSDDREGTLVKTCVYKFNHGESVKLGPCSQMWNYLHILDFVEVIAHLIEEDIPCGIYNVAGNDTRVLQEFVKEIYEVSNRTGAYEFGMSADNPEGSPSLVPDISKILKSIKWNPMVSFRTGICKMMSDLQ